MEFQIGNRLITGVRLAYEGQYNTVWICTAEGNKKGKEMCTVIRLEDRQLLDKLLKAAVHAEKKGRKIWNTSFSFRKKFLAVYPYEEERPLERYYRPKQFSLDKCCDIGVSIAAECATAQWDFSVLYLILEQKQLHIRKNGQVFFGFALDLEHINPFRNEKDCACKCGELIYRLLEDCKGIRERTGFLLLEKKLQKEGYETFDSLLQDLCLLHKKKKSRTFGETCRSFWKRYEKRILKVLAAAGCILGLAALAAALSRAVWGDVPVLRVFFHTFDIIGTENLTGR